MHTFLTPDTPKLQKESLDSLWTSQVTVFPMPNATTGTEIGSTWCSHTWPAINLVTFGKIQINGFHWLTELQHPSHVINLSVFPYHDGVREIPCLKQINKQKKLQSLFLTGQGLLHEDFKHPTLTTLFRTDSLLFGTLHGPLHCSEHLTSSIVGLLGWSNSFSFDLRTRS